MTRRLTKEALQRLNELVAQGVSFADAMAQVADYEPVPEPGPPTPPEPPPRPMATWPEVRDAIDAIFRELLDVGVLVEDPEAGCTPAEINLLASDTGRVLPRAYQHMLSWVGKKRTRFLSHNHIAAELHRLREKQTHAPQWMREAGFEPPAQAFYMLSCLDDSYHYVICDDPEAIDTVVWVAHEGWEAPRASYPSIVAMIRAIADDALRAWNNGYFVHRPNGTSA